MLRNNDSAKQVNLMHVQRIVQNLIDARTWLGLEKPEQARSLIEDIERKARPVHLKRFEEKIGAVRALIEKEMA